MPTTQEDMPATMVRYEAEDKVGIITLDRADKLNAINSVMKDEIIAAFARADKEPATSVIVLRANGRSFSAGFDLGHSPDRGKDSGAADPNTWDTMLHRSFDFGMAPWSTRKPVIASVQGHVLGGGCELTLMCDLTIAADDAKFGEPEVRFSHLGPLMVMPWFVGLKRARELLLFGDMIDAKTALEFGMVNRIVPAADLRAETMKYAKRLSLIAPEALRWGKRVINRGAEIAGFQGRGRGRGRFVRVALCHADRSGERIRPPGAGGRPQGRARVAACAIPNLTERRRTRASAGLTESPIIVWSHFRSDRRPAGNRTQAMNVTKVGIVGLGRWAKVLTRAASKSQALQIVSAYSRSQEKRDAFARELGVAAVPDLGTMLADPAIEGVILTVPNEQHLPLALEVAKAGKHVYTEKPIASTLEEGLAIADLEGRYGVTVTVGHSARLMAGIRRIRAAIDSGELGRVAFMEANFSNERALELTPQTWRWYKHRAPGGPLSQLAIHQFDVLHYLGGDIVEASSMASKLSPVGAEVDDQSMTLIRFADGKIGYVGACWTSPGIFAVRVFGSKGLMHYEIDFGTWDTPEQLHQSSTLYIQRGKDGYAKREELKVPESDMFRAELDLFAASCRSGKGNELSADNGNIALAVVYAALRSIEENGRSIRLADVIETARRHVAERSRNAA